MSMGMSAAATCPFCSSSAPRLYELPARAIRVRQQDRPACYFCYLRMTGIKPTRSRIAPLDAENGAVRRSS